MANPQAVALNETIKNTNLAVYNLLSARGQNSYFPKAGILAQAAQAQGKKINATIGIAVEADGSPMVLPTLAKVFNLPTKSVFPYAPSFGLKPLRDAWLKTIYTKNPSLNNIPLSSPVVTNALTHGLSIAGYLFLNPGDSVILPDYYWENYNLTFSISYDTDIETYPTFIGKGFNVAGLAECLNRPGTKKVMLLNFPNNPTGYTPTEAEAEAIGQAVLKAANGGKEIVVLCDDAYFGLVYEDGIYKESIFAKLSNLHPNVLAIKLDGNSKEDYAWGLRVGFLTFGIKGGTPALYEALEAKAGGAIRGTISNNSHPAQSAILACLNDPAYVEEKKVAYNKLQERYTEVKRVLTTHPEYAQVFEVLPFNSGYFMCVKVKAGMDAEALRQKLLNEYSVGVIVDGDLIRVAFSSTPVAVIEEAFGALFQVAVGSR